MVFRWFYQVIVPPRGSKLGLELHLVLGGILEGVLEVSWEGIGGGKTRTNAQR